MILYIAIPYDWHYLNRKPYVDSETGVEFFDSYAFTKSERIFFTISFMQLCKLIFHKPYR